ncbi:cupin-like domain-containing protein [Leptodontidium sp. MPI-SDFR-AT-0119]|nr:cupin-like domain-containing protein [Leptodontidium sp. MPI-SDFR-AT-0119]
MEPHDPSSQSEDPTITLLQTYNSLNPSTITTLTSLPSPLEFLRFVAQNRPFVIRGGAADWKAVREWNVASLKEVLEGVSVNVAVTPIGNADSPVKSPTTNELLFVKPHEEQQPFSSFLDFIIAQEKAISSTSSSPTSNSTPSHPQPHPQEIPGGEVRYAQTQNDNLPSEYSLLAPSIPRSIPFSRIALSSSPDAINLWIGNSLSVTALHKDNYENIYVQIIGKKHFVLLPPVAWAGVGERVLKGGRYVRRASSTASEETMGISETVGDEGKDGEKEPRFDIIIDEEENSVPFATWDPDPPLSAEEGNGTKYSKFVEPVRVTLEEGDMLYLPALWYHKVSQSCSEEGICVAVNYWHDMEFGGGFWPMCNFVRDVGLAAAAK